MREIHQSSSHPTTITSMSATIQSQARAGVGEKSAATTGTSSRAAAARSITLNTVSARWSRSVGLRLSGSSVMIERIMLGPPGPRCGLD